MRDSNVIPMNREVARPERYLCRAGSAEVVGIRGAGLSPLIRQHLLELINWPRNGRVEIDFSGTLMEAYATEHYVRRGRGCGRRGISVETIRNRKVARNLFLTKVRRMQKNDGRAGRKA